MSDYSSGDIKIFIRDDKSIRFNITDTSEPEVETGIENFILISYFTNARIDSEEFEIGSNGGYFGSDLIGVNIGSRLWTLQKRNIDNSLLRDAEKFCLESIQWMIDDRIIDEAKCSAYRNGSNEIRISTDVYKNLSKETFTYFYNWEKQLMRDES